jgi:hypothetical protein
MRKSRRIARHRRWRWQRRFLVLSLIVGAVCVQAIIYTRLSTHWAPVGNPEAGAPVAHESEPLARAAFPRRLGRPVYKYSVIPGGAYSPEELKQALESDEVAARHYAVFQRASLRTEPSRFVQPVYVSYRVGDAVFWTRRPVALAAHETLLTDGANFARARCGNRVSAEPQSPVQTASPDPAVFEDAETPAPEAVAANRDEPLLAVEVFPGLFQDTPWQTVVPLPDGIGEAQQDTGDGFQMAAVGSVPAMRPTSREIPIDQLSIPDLPGVDLVWPLDCGSIAWPPDALPDSPRNPRACAALDWLRYRLPESPPEPAPPTPIPEPGSLVLALGGLGVAVAVRRLARWKRRPGTPA